MQKNFLAEGGTRFAPSIEWSPADLGVNAVDFKAVATTLYTGSIIQTYGFKHYTVALVYTIVGTAPTVTVIDVRVEVFEPTADTLIAGPVDILVVDASTEVAATYNTHASWGDGTAAKHGTGTITAANLDSLKAFSQIRLSILVDTASDATTSHVGSLYLMAN